MGSMTAGEVLKRNWTLKLSDWDHNGKQSQGAETARDRRSERGADNAADRTTNSIERSGAQAGRR